MQPRRMTTVLATALWSAALIAVLAQPPADRDGARQASLQQELDAAFALHTAGQHPEAARQYRRTIEALQGSAGPPQSAQPGDWRSSILQALTICAHNLAHISAEHLDDLEEARRWFTEATRIEPTYARAYYNLGQALLRRTHFEEAIQQFGHDIRLRPNSVEPVLHTAAAYYELGQHLDASAQALQAVAVSPASASTLSSAGKLLLLAERYRAAEEVLRRGLQLEPSSAEMHLNMGRWAFCRAILLIARRDRSHDSRHLVIDWQGAIRDAQQHGGGHGDAAGTRAGPLSARNAPVPRAPILSHCAASRQQW